MKKTESTITFTPELIRDVRKRAGLSQTEFANILGTRQATISDWERGMSEPSPMALKLLEMYIRTFKSVSIPKNKSEKF